MIGYWVVVLDRERHAFSFPLTERTPPAPDSSLAVPGGGECVVRTVIHRPGDTGVIVANTTSRPSTRTEPL